MSATASIAVSVSVTASTRKCGVCGTAGHDRRNCPSKPATAAPAAPVYTNDHSAFLSRLLTGPARPLNPDTYWAGLGSDAGAYPFLRDTHGALHLPLVCVGDGGSMRAHSDLSKMTEYAWDAAAKVFRRTGPCPGCH